VATIEFPDGTIIRANSLARRDENALWRDLGLYLDPAWLPSWPATVLDWPDFGLPASNEEAFKTIRSVFDRARAGVRVEVGCLGGLGRTGTVLACFAVICGLVPAEALTWVRKHYDCRAVETPAQEAWVAWFGQRLAAEDGNRA
jgi:hypothetical protein